MNKTRSKFAFSMLFIVILSLPLIAYKGSNIKYLKQSMQELLPSLSNYTELKSVSLAEYYGTESEKPIEEKGEKIQALWEYINGAAEIYHQYSFRFLQVKRYKHKNKKDAEITLEIYKMENPLNAFGIYSNERQGITKFLDIRQQGYYVKDSFSFWKGDYYVKLTSYGFDESQSILTKMARETSSLITDVTPPPPDIKLFPEKGNIRNSVTYVPSSLLGLEFMGDGFTARYSSKDVNCELFLKSLSSSNEAEELFEKCSDFLKGRGKIIEPPESWDEDTIHCIKESMIGDIVIFIKNNVIAGITDFDDINSGIKTAELLHRSIN